MPNCSSCTWTAAGESGPADVGQLELLVGEVDGVVDDVVLDVGGFRHRRGRRRRRSAARVGQEDRVRHCVGRRGVRGGGGRVVGHDVILKLE